MEGEYLGLSLSLSCCSSSNGGSPRHLTLLPPSSSSQRQWRHLHAGIDVNRAPAPSSETTVFRSREEDGGGATSQRDATERTSDDEDDGDGGRKKLRLSKEQAAVLEESFKEHSTLNPKQKLALAKQLHLRPRQVEVWFQNRRARTKLKQTEVDCELLRRCCQELTEENTRLHKEVQELRALKLSPQFYMHMTPPTTLTLCPSCDRLSTSSKNQTPPEHHQFLRRNHQKPVVARWAPISLCPSFLDAPLQRS